MAYIPIHLDYQVVSRTDTITANWAMSKSYTAPAGYRILSFMVSHASNPNWAKAYNYAIASDGKSCSWIAESTAGTDEDVTVFVAMLKVDDS